MGMHARINPPNTQILPCKTNPPICQRRRCKSDGLTFRKVSRSMRKSKVGCATCTASFAKARVPFNASMLAKRRYALAPVSILTTNPQRLRNRKAFFIFCTGWFYNIDVLFAQFLDFLKQLAVEMVSLLVVEPSEFVEISYHAHGMYQEKAQTTM